MECWYNVAQQKPPHGEDILLWLGEDVGQVVGYYDKHDGKFYNSWSDDEFRFKNFIWRLMPPGPGLDE